ncbi:chromosome segregation protein ParM [Hydrocarboniphaga effusa]|jgi:hypothetical protein|uniref:antitoxin VbhA family protein n=1 Tax=Hydrocarboniphaga effusa TaxID=243629 RepID=UPI003BACAD83
MPTSAGIGELERMRRAEAVRAARASVELEGYVLRAVREQIDNQFIAGELTLPEYIAACQRAAGFP